QQLLAEADSRYPQMRALHIFWVEADVAGKPLTYLLAFLGAERIALVERFGVGTTAKCCYLVQKLPQGFRLVRRSVVMPCNGRKGRQRHDELMVHSGRKGTEVER